MNITRETIKSTLRNIMAEESEYQTFFKKALEKAGKSIPSMSDEEKKAFFNKIDAAWNAKGEKNEGNAFGAAVVAAKEKGEDEFEVGGKTYKVESVNEAKANPATKKFLKGMQSIKVNGLGGYMPGVRNVYWDKKNKKFWFVDFEGDHAELLNTSTLKQLDTHIKKSNITLESVNESAGCSCGCGTCSETVNEEWNSKDSTFEKVYAMFDKKDYFNAKGLAKVQIGNFERALQRNDKGAQQILDKFGGDMDKAKEYITQVVSDQKKAKAFGDYQNFKDAVDSIVRGKPKSSAVEFIKGRAHNNRQKYTMALYSALRGKKFNNYKDIHTDLDSLIGESVNEGRAFINAARKAKEEGKTEFEFNGKTYPVTLKEETINERRLGKVSLLRTVEKGDSSYVEGVKISPELAFELRMFLQRPMLARTRTGIAIDNAQMKDALGMLAKVGVQKRLSSGVRKEFDNLLNKYNK